MVNFHNVNCMDFMKALPDKAYDLAIVDPPYGIGMHTGNSDWIRTQFKGSDKKWDNCKPDDQYFIELERVSENRIIWGANYFTEHLPASMGWICWYKTIECVGRCFSEFELAFSSFERAARICELKPFQRNGSRIHPTQKPIELYKWLLNNYAKPGDRILDTHGGSCSHAIAAYDLGFDLDIMELDPDYFKAALARYEAHVAKYSPASEIPVTKKGEIKLF